MVSLSEFCRKAVGVNQQTTVHALSVASLHCSIGFPASLAPCGKFNKSFHNKSFHNKSFHYLSLSVSVSVSIYPCTAKHNDLAAMSWLCAIHASLLFLPKRETARTSIMDCVKLPRCIKLPFLGKGCPCSSSHRSCCPDQHVITRWLDLVGLLKSGKAVSG